MSPLMGNYGIPEQGMRGARKAGPLVTVALIATWIAGFLAFIIVPPASAAANEVLILGSTVSGGTSSIEASEVTAKGLTPVVVDDATWQSMNQAQFAAYRAVILGDATCSSTIPTAAQSSVGTWGPAVTGNVLIVGTDPVYHASQGGEAVTRRGVDFVVDQVGKTGAFIALSCYYEGTAPKNPVPLLDALRPNGFTVTGVGCYNSAHIVATHPALSGLTDDQLSNWTCSVHEAFDTWPADFTVLTIAKDFGAAYTASDGTVGTPYILARGSGLRSFPLSLDPVTQSRETGTSAAVTAQLLDGATSAPVSGARLSARISAGPNANATVPCGSCTTDTAGHAVFSYVGGSAVGTDTLQVWIDTDANGVPSPGEPQTTAAITWTAAPAGAGAYVALGDSFSSGEGNPPFQPDSNDPLTFNDCHRSDVAYGPRLDLGKKLGPMIFKACSGAVTNDFFAANHANPNEPDQTSWLTDQTRTVTLTIGGNDAGFPNVLQHCVQGVRPPADGWLSLDYKYVGFGCSSSNGLKRDTTNRMNALAGKGDGSALLVGTPIHSELSVLERIHAKAKNAKIYIAGYPKFFGEAKGNYKAYLLHSVCPVGPAGAEMGATVDRADALWLNERAVQLNGIIQQAVLDAKAEGIDVTYVNPAFQGRGLCDMKESYFNAVILAAGGGLDPGSFHPNFLGQLYGYYNYAFRPKVK